MKEYQPNDTYKLLWDQIIEELLIQICNNDQAYCVRDEKIHLLIGKKFEEYKHMALKNMTRTRLDRHKLASCICGAIIECKPLVGYNNAQITKGANEIVALSVGLNIIKFYMMNEFLFSLKLNEKERDDALVYLKENFDMDFPLKEENICDEKPYRENLTNALYWTHHECGDANRLCHHYDIWAYSKIFYHLEIYNKDILRKSFKKYIKKSN